MWGYEAQDTKNFELIVADDGSRKETYDMLQRITPQLSFQVKHVWHEDKGFRKCDILNKGILAAQADYLLFSDGDCIHVKTSSQLTCVFAVKDVSCPADIIS